jgi:hypothetical protein
MDERERARVLGTARVAVGAAMFLAPKWAGRTWVGRDADTPGAKTITRGFGARDMAIGIGLLSALGEGKGAGRWLMLGAVADGGDAVSTLLSWGRLPRLARLTIFAGAAAACVSGAMLSSRVD